MKRAAVFFGTGYEEIEALTVVDLLRRAGVETVCVAVDNAQTVMGKHKITVTMDAGIDTLDFDNFDILVCPGGMPGTKKLEECAKLTEQLRKFYECGKLIAAICAAPSIFGHMGLLHEKKACIYPGMETELLGAEVCFDKVVKSGNVITSRGMGTAIAFSLEIIASLLDQKTADELGEQIVYTEGC
ncbi:protein/nucleic acid deglycase 3 [Lachnospiraceae bacterium]|nr:protein/nucleic acid deglycase 3 [Lachnospiraceae bacterium]